MRLAGMFLLLSGWLIVIFAIVLFTVPLSRTLFVLSGVAVEIAGLVLAFRKEAL